MGFYMKKSIQFGNLRMNFSKSGVSYSYGVKGLRIGTGPRGNYVHISAGGLSYSKTSGHSSNQNSLNMPTRRSLEQEEEYYFRNTDSKDAGVISDSNHMELLKEINIKNKKVRFNMLLSLVCISQPKIK